MGGLVYDEFLKIERTVIRIGNVIPNAPSAQYNHDNPTDGLVYGDKVLGLDGTEICLLLPSCSMYNQKIDEVDKHNLVTYLMKNPSRLRLRQGRNSRISAKVTTTCTLLN